MQDRGKNNLVFSNTGTPDSLIFSILTQPISQVSYLLKIKQSLTQTF